MEDFLYFKSERPEGMLRNRIRTCDPYSQRDPFGTPQVPKAFLRK